MVLNLSEPISGKAGKDLVDLERRGKNWVVKADGKDISVTVDPLTFRRLRRDSYKAIVQPDLQSVEVILFAGLHRHTDNSLLDGMTKVSQLVQMTEYAGAITDHGNMFGYCEFYKGMKAAGKKPIIGVEVYTYSLDEVHPNRHLVLLAKNNVGYHNLLKLVSESHDHFYRHPQVTWEMLEKYHEGIIACAACIGGVIQRYVTENDFEHAEEAIQRYIGIFGEEDFYLEVQRHGIPQEGMVEAYFQDMAAKYGLKIIATTDAHYPTKKDAYPHEILLCMQQGKTIVEDHWKFEGTGYHVHNSAEMEELFGDHPEWLDNTLDLADKCEVEIPLGHVNLPKYEVPAPFMSPDDYFEHLCHEGFKTRFEGTPQFTDEEYKKRFDYELNMIKQMGFPSYFLIVQDCINWARDHDIYVGPGRGSAAGSLVAYCIGITDIDPLKYGLLFERFLNPERVSMPDIDTDYEHTKREQVLNYVAQKYGEENVCHIVTFGTEGAKTSIRDVVRVLDYPPSVGAKLSKLVPKDPKITIELAMDTSYELRNTYDTDPDAKRIIDIALRIEGCKRHSSQNACFAADTLITTKTGKKRISSVQSGDEVLTHLGQYKPVVKTIVNKSSDIYLLNLSNGQVLEVTGNHPLLWVKNGKVSGLSASCELEWCEVKFLSVGDAVYGLDDSGKGEVVHITRKEKLPKTQQDMYNLSVLDDNSYVANSIAAHNCGFIVAPGKVDEWLPTSMEKDEDGNKAITSQVTMSEAEELGLLKMDFLGLKNMTVIHDVINAIKTTRGIDIDYHDIPMDDRETYEMLAAGLTGGVFQLESPGMTRVVQQMLEDVSSLPEERLAECFERMIAAVALYRPGPMDYIPDYVRGVNSDSAIHYDDPREEPYLKNTYGVLVYQEQLMQIAQVLAGYSLGEADMIRKACGQTGHASVAIRVLEQG